MKYLVTQSVREENIKFRQKVLNDREISSRGWYGKLVLKYRKWHKETTGRDDYLTDESSSDEEIEDDEEEEPSWLKHYISPSQHILTSDDGNTSDDGLDGDREGVKTFCREERFASEIARLLRHKDDKPDPIVESFMSNLQKVKAPGNNCMYTIKIQLLNIREDIHRVVKVPARLSLCTLQEKVFCPLMGWLPNLVPYAFHLATNKYAEGEKPDDFQEDVCISSIGMNSGPSLGLPAIERGSAHIIDDRRVAVFQVLQGKGDHLYYQHGRYYHDGSSSGNYKIIVDDVTENEDATEGFDAVQVLSGRGPVPDECGLKPSWEDPRHYGCVGDTGIYGTKAFCISIDIVQNRSEHEEWAVKKAEKHLKLKPNEPLDFDKFDVRTANKEIRKMSRKFPIKKGAVDGKLFFIIVLNFMKPTW